MLSELLQKKERRADSAAAHQDETVRGSQGGVPLTAAGAVAREGEKGPSRAAKRMADEREVAIE
jgi:hypothetical protein